MQSKEGELKKLKARSNLRRRNLTIRVKLKSTLTNLDINIIRSFYKF